MKVPNEFRITSGPMGSNESIGNNGAFRIRFENRELFIIASDQGGWEHVSVTYGDSKQPPSWKVMCFVKDLFWGEDECVLQFHPPKKEYINNHRGCLHLWKPVDVEIQTPPSWMVGFK